MGSLIHISVDLALVAIVLAAVRENAGFILNFQDSNLSGIAKAYTSFGQYLYHKLISYAKNSSYFKSINPLNTFVDGVSQTLNNLGNDVSTQVTRTAKDIQKNSRASAGPTLSQQNLD